MSRSTSLPRMTGHDPAEPGRGSPESEHSAEAAAAAPASERSGSATPVAWLREPHQLRGSVLLERYRVSSVMGRGPLGVCLLANPVQGAERTVLVKLVPRPPECPPERFTWLVREALALAQFDQESTESFFDWGHFDAEGSVLLVRAHVPGPSLRQRLQQGLMPLDEALALGLQLATALSAAHARDIQHGRLKPENVIFTDARADEARVVDFGCNGLPTGCEQVVYNSTAAPGLPPLGVRGRAYAPPSARAASPAAADVHALGVILYELLAGELPYPAEHLNQPFRQPIPLLHPGVPRAVADIVMALLSPEPPTARSVQRALTSLALDPTRAPQMSLISVQSVAPPVLAPPAPMPAARQPQPSAPGTRARSIPPPLRHELLPPALPSSQHGVPLSSPLPSSPRASSPSLRASPPSLPQAAPPPTPQAPAVSSQPPSAGVLLPSRGSWALESPVIATPLRGDAPAFGLHSLPGAPGADLDVGDTESLRPPGLLSRLFRLFRRTPKPPPF
jgi:eukaryotic-like serine/threonine-protein kinase